MHETARELQRSCQIFSKFIKVTKHEHCENYYLSHVSILRPMLHCQKLLFQLPPDIHYLNGAYMTPLLTSVYEAGVAGLQWKLDPSKITSRDFFELPEIVRQKFGLLINAPAFQIAITPSASYGLKAAIENLPKNSGNHAIVMQYEFPSAHYTIARWCHKNDQELRIIRPPKTTEDRGKAWNRQLLESISEETTVVVLTPLHWADGTLFNLKQIGEKCKRSNTRLIIDGTQSVGMIPIDVIGSFIDVLVTACHKWLLGPYSLALAYYSESYNNGEPIEDSWMNRANAEDFANLSNFTDEYRPGAARYNMGETTSPIHLRMLAQSLDVITSWGVENLQQYTRELIKPLLEYLRKNNLWVEDDEYRASHLLGFALPASANKNDVLQELQKRKVFVSLRGNNIRVSPHVYNDADDIAALMEALDKALI